MESLSHVNQSPGSTLTFTDEDLQLFGDRLEKVTYDINAYLIQPNEVENYVYFILEGAVKAFILQKNKPICIDFVSEGTIYCSFASFLTRQSSRLAIQTLSKVTVYRIHYDQVYEFSKSSESHKQFEQKLTEAFYIERFNQILLFAGLDAEERYQNLLVNRPSLLRMVPIKDLATYLGVHSGSLSRLRRKIYHEDNGTKPKNSLKK